MHWRETSACSRELISVSDCSRLELDFELIRPASVILDLMATRHHARVWLALVTVYLVWGSTFIALAIVVRDFPPYLAMAMRHLVAGAALLSIRAGREVIVRRTRSGGSRCAPASSSGPPLPARPRLARVGNRPFPAGSRRSSSAASRSGWRCSTGWRSGAAYTPLPMSASRSDLPGSRLFDLFGEGSVDRFGALVIVLSALCWAAGSLYSRGAPSPGARSSRPGSASLCGGALLFATSVVLGELGRVHFSLDALLALGYLVVAGTFVGFTSTSGCFESLPSRWSPRTRT